MGKNNNSYTLDDTVSSSFLKSSIGTKIAGALGQEQAKESMCPSLTLKQRVIGYAVCTILGTHFSHLL